jgi:SAM-dependent methyltransferase
MGLKAQLLEHVKHRVRTALGLKPNPKKYSTLSGAGSFIPVQLEAYLLAAGKHVAPGDKVLDIGFGLGYGLIALGINAGEVSGLDVDPTVLAYVKSLLEGKHPKLKSLGLYDGYDTKFPDGSFDVVTCVDCLEHVEDYHRLLKELLRVSRKGVFISTPNRRPEHTNSDGTPKNYWHLREWNHEELKEIMEKHGPVEWTFLDGPFSGPFRRADRPGPDTMALCPFVRKRA